MLLINHPPLGPKSPAYLKILAALQAVSDSPSAFFTTGAPGDAEREELILGTELFDLPVARRAYLYLLRSYLGRRVPAVMTVEQLGKQQLLAAQLFAEARNAFAKAGQTQQELIAFFLAVRCALRSQVILPGYLEEMTTQYARAVGARAERLSNEQLSRHDLAGFLAMTTIAFSAYEDNAAPLSKTELKRYGGLTVRSLTNLHEYLKAKQSTLPATDAAVALRSMALMVAAHPTDVLPDWLQEVVERAPIRAATAFLQEAAAQDKKRKIAVSMWWWAQAAEALDFGSEFDDWQKPFIHIAPSEAAKRLGELAVKEREARKDFHTYAYLASLAHRLVRRMNEEPTDWLAGFRSDEVANVMTGLRELAKRDESSDPNLLRGIEGTLCVAIANGTHSEISVTEAARPAFRRLVEMRDITDIEI